MVGVRSCEVSIRIPRVCVEDHSREVQSERSWPSALLVAPFTLITGVWTKQLEDCIFFTDHVILPESGISGYEPHAPPVLSRPSWSYNRDGWAAGRALEAPIAATAATAETIALRGGVGHTAAKLSRRDESAFILAFGAQYARVASILTPLTTGGS